MGYYLVKAKCGHVGKNRYIPIWFPIEAEGGKEAARIARNIGRVKHDHKDAILEVKKVSYEEFFKQEILNMFDPYLCVTSSHEQDLVMKDIIDRLEVDNHKEEVEASRRVERHRRVNLKYQNLKYSYCHSSY